MEQANHRGLGRAAALLALALAAGPLAAQTPRPGDAVALGRYLVQIAGCNDCHTPGYAMAAGRVDEKEWLTGDPPAGAAPGAPATPSTCGSTSRA